MVVESLDVRGFRNLADGEVPLAQGINLVHGPNGAGKTNLLEALHLALAGRSCRTRDDRQVIAFGEPLARASARLRTRSHRVELLCAVSRSEGRRRLVDGSPASADAEELRPPIAVFMPDRLEVVKGAPSLRRAHLDAFATALRPARAEVRRRYSRALAQRNALLGRIRAGSAGEASLDAWDAELAAAGVELGAVRAEAAATLAGPYAEAASELGVEPRATLDYRPRSKATSPDELARELAERRRSDIARGYSGFGPHLDDLALELGGRAIRRYGSQGQQRLALLALLFAERTALIGAGRPAPLMLLDDVTSELDATRRGLLVERLAAGEGQSLITATEPEQLPRAAPRSEIVVRDGRALAIAAGREDAAA